MEEPCARRPPSHVKPSETTETIRSVRTKRRVSRNSEGFAQGPERDAYPSNSAPSWAGWGSDELAMTVPLIAIVGVPIPVEPGAIGVCSDIVAT